MKAEASIKLAPVAQVNIVGSCVQDPDAQENQECVLNRSEQLRMSHHRHRRTPAAKDIYRWSVIEMDLDSSAGIQELLQE